MFSVLIGGCSGDLFISVLMSYSSLVSHNVAELRHKKNPKNADYQNLWRVEKNKIFSEGHCRNLCTNGTSQSNVRWPPYAFTNILLMLRNLWCATFTRRMSCKQKRLSNESIDLTIYCLTQPEMAAVEAASPFHGPSLITQRESNLQKDSEADKLICTSLTSSRQRRAVYLGDFKSH